MRSEQDSSASINHEYQSSDNNGGDCIFDEFGLCGRHEHGSDLCSPISNHNSRSIHRETRLESPGQHDRVNNGDCNDIHNHLEGENENGYKNPDRSWSDDFFAVHTAYKDSVASLHFNLCSDLHQRLLEHRHAMRQLQGQIYQEIGQLEPLLSDVVHDRVMPKMIYDLEAQRFCCREVGRVLKNELNDSLMLLNSKVDKVEALRRSTLESNEDEDDDDKSQTSRNGISKEASGGVDENWTLFGWSVAEKPFASWKEAFITRRQFRDLMEDTADNSVFEEGDDGTDREDPYKKLGCFHSNTPIHEYDNNNTQALTENDHGMKEEPTAPRKDVHPNGVDPSLDLRPWSLLRGSKISSESHSSLKRMSRSTRVTDDETECERERYSTKVNSRPRRLATGGSAYTVLKNVQNFYQGEVHYHYATASPPPTPCTRERATRRGYDDDNGDDGSGDVNESHNVSEDTHGCKETHPYKKPQSRHSRYTYSSKSSERRCNGNRSQDKQRQQQQHHRAKNEDEDKSNCNNSDVTLETPSPNINNYLGNNEHQQEPPQRNRPDYPPRLARHTKVIDWRLFYRNQFYQRRGQRTQDEEEDEQRTMDDSRNHLNRDPNHDKKLNVRDQDWFRDLHVKESTLILEGRRDEAISVRRIRNALRACFHVGVWAGLSHHQDLGRGRSCSRGRIFCRRGCLDHHQVRGQTHSAREKCRARNMQSWYMDSLRARTRHTITKQKKEIVILKLDNDLYRSNCPEI
ncbi:hypothetical protein BGX26_000190 [Mortierella sp. AD094]|nr:hypothetical protein BGX26_000190 [Mortierella sp. AD094]